MKARQWAFIFESGISKVFLLWIYWIFIFLLQKPLFMLYYKGLYAEQGVGEWLRVCWHGLPLDVSMAGYLTALPLVVVLIHLWRPAKWLRICCQVWLGISSLLVALTFLLNVVLYEYWNFPLDATPLFYFFTSPKDAFASATPFLLIMGVVLLVLLSLLLYFGASRALSIRELGWRKRMMLGQQLAATILFLFFGGLMFVAIRGGLKVSSMNTGKVYFSQQQSLNHAAVNSMFSLLESLSHQNDFDKQYRFMDEKEATLLFRQMTRHGNGCVDSLFTLSRPDIYLVILESFSSKLMKTLGGNGVAASLDKLADEGLLFTNFYANSFRTDRGLVSILCGYPAQPTMSLMKYPHKTSSLPSLAKSLKKEGYELAYYYGGDADFTNMRSFLLNQGFERLISDVDFPMKDRLSKWGVPDHLVFERMKSDLEEEWSAEISKKEITPCFRVLQTSSSHEPFDVPYHKLPDERLNAFAYTDTYLGRFIEWLRHTDRWEHSLVIIVPDHLGCYPQGISNFDFSRYQIPLLMVGGALKCHKHIDVFGSQQDIAATLLSQLGIDHHEFLFSKDMLDQSAPHFAFFAVPDAFGIVKDGKERLIYDNKSGKVVAGDMSDSLLMSGKAYLQKLYDDIDKR